VDEVFEFYQMADVFLLGSLAEGTPNVLLEAMSCGLPVICRELDGISEFLIYQGKNGYFYNDFESFESAFLKLYRNAERRKDFGRVSRELIEANHSFRNLYSKVFHP
jgi:glycosyltransferase involved in cell wall biosynthesis